FKNEAALFQSTPRVVQALDSFVEPILYLDQRVAVDFLEQSAPLGILMTGIRPSNLIVVIQEAFKTDFHPGGAAVHGVFASIGRCNQTSKLVDLGGEPFDVGADLLQVVA
ncbi:MAG: hypothetical protein OXU26_16140, partial [Acidobacteriota bacterium]|nr:hypothetical protein [Acidobacteriota bacterium]